MKVRVSRLVECVVGLLILALSWSVGMTARAVAQKGEAALTWPHVQGQIIKAEIKTRISGRARNRGVTYYPDIQYVYQVNGSIYQGSEISPFFDYWSVQKDGEIDSSAHAALRRFPKGSFQNVYYNPSNPSESLLDPHYSSSATFLALIFCGIGIAVLIHAAMRKKENPGYGVA